MKLGEGLLGVTNPKKSNALERLEKFLNELCRLIYRGVINALPTLQHLLRGFCFSWVIDYFSNGKKVERDG